jgi:hypothetical protein
MSGSSLLGSDNLACGANTFALTRNQIPWSGGVVFMTNRIFAVMSDWAVRNPIEITRQPMACFSSNNTVELVIVEQNNDLIVIPPLLLSWEIYCFQTDLK